jgi:ethanolamine kinase
MKEPRIAAEIAKEIRRFHQVDIPGSKEPQLWDDIFKFMKKGTLPMIYHTFKFVT